MIASFRSTLSEINNADLILLEDETFLTQEGTDDFGFIPGHIHLDG